MKKKLEFSSETLAMVSPTASAYTQDDSKEVSHQTKEPHHVHEQICTTPGCVLAGNYKRWLTINYYLQIILIKNSFGTFEKYGPDGGSL